MSSSARALRNQQEQGGYCSNSDSDLPLDRRPEIIEAVAYFDRRTKCSVSKDLEVFVLVLSLFGGMFFMAFAMYLYYRCKSSENGYVRLGQGKDKNSF